MTLGRGQIGALLAAALDGALTARGGALDAPRLAHWAENLRALAVRYFLAHPALTIMALSLRTAARMLA